ncbi:Transcriptional regulator MraZ [Adhaeretor mobilis]|uniref:Transcriptional regulator MraZ n=2 Tax=Adhaeretor mobilis TaxID=1930276 RepID=A0A517MVS3_9BACT|nr:Transcriptional regulator MraZ [Adhaeretor mobilis]
MVLTGLYRRSLDDKQRLALPKPLRSKVLESEPMYVTPGLDGCIAVYPEQAFAALAERLAIGSPAAKEVREYSRLFYSQASCVEIDRQSRIRIPQSLLDWADVSVEAVVVGVRDHLEIWSGERWEEFVASRDQQYEDLAVTAFAPQPAIDPTKIAADTAATLEAPLKPQPK